jgi:hypothetical protein
VADVAVVRLAGEDLPAVELVHTGGIYFVRDGHHRISVAKALSEAYIDAEVIDETCSCTLSSGLIRLASVATNSVSPL